MNAEELEAELSDLRAKHARIVYAYAAMLSRFTDKGHGAARTSWVRVETVEGWHKTYRDVTS